MGKSRVDRMSIEERIRYLQKKFNYSYLQAEAIAVQEARQSK